MAGTVDLRQGIEMIWETVQINNDYGVGAECPYIFIVGAGISAPEIPSASGIVRHCQDKIKELLKNNQEDMNDIFDKGETMPINSAKYYSYWFEQAYKNKIHRQQYLKSIIRNARISTSNLLLAQILDSREIATTVITPNFDNHLLKSLNLLGNYDVFSADNALDNIALTKNSEEIQIMHVHGTYQFYDCCNLENEIGRIAQGQGIKSTAGTIEEFLKTQSPIVIGYSGWEDDVIMSKLRERLQYAPLPYNMLWFCYSMKSYENLPNWLKDSEDVVFIIPELGDNIDMDSDINAAKDIQVLPAEDVLTALITRFGFKAPNLFSNPIQYYIDLIDSFLPQNMDIFPINSWKRRLDYVDTHIGDIDRKMITLEEAAARKDVIDLSRILREMDYSFISIDDLEHIINGIILPLINSKNRIEDKHDLFEFIDVVLDLLGFRYNDISIDKTKDYLERIVGILPSFTKDLDSDMVIRVYDKILVLCEKDTLYEEIELTMLGMKSDVIDDPQRFELQNEIIRRGTESIEKPIIARILLIAIYKQAIKCKSIQEMHIKIMDQVLENHSNNEWILNVYYRHLLKYYEKEIKTDIEIDDLIDQIMQKGLSKELLLHARFIKYNSTKDDNLKLMIARNAINNYDFKGFNHCNECWDYAFLLAYIIMRTIDLEEAMEQKYIDRAMQVCSSCSREGGCEFIHVLLLDALGLYVMSIHNRYEKRELCKKAIEICHKNKLYNKWGLFNDIYIEQLDEQKRKNYILANEQYKAFCDAREKVSSAIQAYINHDIEMCGSLLFEASEVFNELFEGRYNVALLNICFMARRNEFPKQEIPVLDTLNSITWMDSDAFLNINKALVYISESDWDRARKQIFDIDSNLVSAIEWWNQEDVVGRKERFTVLLLLALEGKLEEGDGVLGTEEFWDYCINNLSIPNDIIDEVLDIKKKYI